MDLNASTLWWLAGGALVAIELATGTFYLLMLAIGCAAAAVAAHVGVGSTGQLLAAALIGGGAVVFWHLRRSRQPASGPEQSNRDLHLDIGGTVPVTAWRENGTARVHYRGAAWEARFAGPGQPTPGSHTVSAVDGNCLVLSRSPT